MSKSNQIISRYVYSTYGELAAVLIATFFVFEVLLSIAFISVGFGNNLDR